MDRQRSAKANQVTDIVNGHGWSLPVRHGLRGHFFSPISQLPPASGIMRFPRALRSSSDSCLCPPASGCPQRMEWRPLGERGEEGPPARPNGGLVVSSQNPKSPRALLIARVRLPRDLRTTPTQTRNHIQQCPGDEGDTILVLCSPAAGKGLDT